MELKMRFPERKEAVEHLTKLGGDLCKIYDRGLDVVIMVPNKESAYAYARGETEELEYEEGFRVTAVNNYYETWSKDRSGKWVKGIM
jgi:glutamine phosphoribosylpyrophosphate amidotransferase